MPSQTKSVPAPVGGVNARDSLASMPPTDAIVMDNWFPLTSAVSVRNGCQVWATGLPGPVNTVMAFNGLTTRKLFAASGTSIYDVTSTGAVGGAVVTGLTSDKLQHVMFNAGGGNVLVWVNGVDTPQVYNGSTWANSTVSGSGLTPANLITVTAFQNRCWYIEKDSMNVWYTGVLAYQGALTKLPLGQLFRMGGTLVQMATWTVDNVSGMNDWAAFITSEGEVAIYQGYDPSTTSTWSLIGVFRVGRPIGRRCYTKVASDVFIITADGLTPLSAAMLTDRVQGDKEVTYKIANAINNDVQQFNANFGWQVIEFPLGNKLIINVPESSTISHQWVMNSITKAWCRFRNWNAYCWELQQDSLYFGGNTIVYQADVGNADAGNAITADCKPAFSYFDLPGQMKQFVMCRPIFQTSYPIQPTVTLNVDFNDVPGTNLTFNYAGTSPWNTSPWNTTPWAGISNQFIEKNWQGTGGLGYVATGRVTVNLSGIAVQWFSTDYMFSPGGPI